MTYTNADALADLEHAKELLQSDEERLRADTLIRKLSRSRSPDAECTNAKAITLIREMAGEIAPQTPKKPFWSRFFSLGMKPS